MITEDGYIFGNTSLDPQTQNAIGVDIEGNPNGICSRLAKLKTTYKVIYQGEYRQLPGYHQVVVITSWTESQLENWLYNIKQIDFYSYGFWDADLEIYLD